MRRWLSGVTIATLAFSIALMSQAEAARRRSPLESNAPATPEIRLTATNAVPQCVTPERLMQFMQSQNDHLDQKYTSIAVDYKKYGEALRIRWDFAFYQMLLETNYLKYRHGDGSPGDVKPKQNNFAGLGATGGGVPGESFPDVTTGVLAQLQHLVAYSGEMVDKPVAKRTHENQDGIIAESKRLGRAVRFGDLTNRWAADRSYARSIISVSERFRDGYCKGAGAGDQPTAVNDKPDGAMLAKKAAAEQPATQRVALGASTAAARPAAQPIAQCQVMTASYGGAVTLLIRAETAKGVVLTALDVTGGNEDTQAAAYIATHAPGGKVTGRFKTRTEAVAHAYELCDSGRP